LGKSISLFSYRNKKPPIMATLYLKRYECNTIHADMLIYYDNDGT